MEILSSLENQNPTLYGKCSERSITADDEDDFVVDLFDEREIFGTSNYLINMSKI